MIKFIRHYWLLIAMCALVAWWNPIEDHHARGNGTFFNTTGSKK